MHNCVSCYLTSLASQRFCDSPWCRDSFSVTSCTQLLPARLVDSFDFRGLAGDKREAPASARILGMTTILFKVGNMNLRVKPLQCDQESIIVRSSSSNARGEGPAPRLHHPTPEDDWVGHLLGFSLLSAINFQCIC